MANRYLLIMSTAWLLSRIKNRFRRVGSAGFIVLAMASPNYQMQGSSLSSGAGTSASTNYSAHTTVGETSGQNMSGSGKQTNPGYIATIQANVTAAPTVSNPADYYNKLKVVLDTGGNPTDAKFALAISGDGFVTTQYVQSDLTMGATLGTEDWRTYTDWGGASGFNVIGLTPSTTYSVKVKATRGNYTESGWSEVGSAATVAPYISFDLDVSPTDTETASPYTVALGDLTVGAVTTAADLVWIDFATNADFGGQVYLSAGTTGLFSTSANYTITSATADLASSGVAQGFGLRSASVTQTSGGPLTAASPYNGTSDSVGLVDSTIRQVYYASAPIVGGRASMYVKAKSSAMTPAASDYTATLTMVATAIF